ncbi:MAG: alpha/beta hydrolase family protein [Gemmatirosa sp.]
MRRGAIAAAASVVALTGAAAGAQAPTLLPVARGGFVLLVGADTFAVEHVTRTVSGFEGELFLRGPRQRIAYTATTEPDARVHRVQLYQWAPRAAADARPVGNVQYLFAGDTLVVTGSPGNVSMQRLPLLGGTLPWFNPSLAFAEQLTRRARRMGATIDGLRRDVPVVNLGSGARSGVGITALGRDTMLLDFGGTELRLAVDSVGTVLGGRLPAQGLTIVRATDLDPSAGRGLPDYGAPPGAPYVAEEVRVPTPQGHALVGTLTRPVGVAARVPVVVTISGSGPQDRDGQIVGIPDYRPFRAIADTLGRRGIAVLRLDERGVGASTGAFGTATSRDFADDVRAALAWLRTRPDVDPTRLALLGHSEGAMIAPMVAAEDPALAGLVLLAGPGIPGRRILDYQSRLGVLRLVGVPPARRDSMLAVVGRAVDSALTQSAWLRWFAAHDPQPVARQVRAPTLILHGTTDRQVTPDQADSLAVAMRAGGNRAVTRRLLPAVNHLFLADPSGDPAGYVALADKRLPPAVLGLIVEWLAATLRAEAVPIRK